MDKNAVPFAESVVKPTECAHAKSGQRDAITSLAIRRAMSIVCLLPVTCRVM
jgi:hypothetical protein